MSTLFWACVLVVLYVLLFLYRAHTGQAIPLLALWVAVACVFYWLKLYFWEEKVDDQDRKIRRPEWEEKVDEWESSIYELRYRMMAWLFLLAFIGAVAYFVLRG